MAIPVVYNLRSVKARWTSAIVAVVGIDKIADAVTETA